MAINSIKIKTPKGIRLIGPGQPVFIVAEMSSNHAQNIDKAFKIIKAAAEAGADAVKIQTYTPDTITIDSNKEYFQIKVNNAWKGQTLYNLYKKTYLPWEWQPKLKKYAEKMGLVLFSSPFDAKAVDFLEKMKVGLYKVASFEIIDTILLKRIGKTKKPVIMSRGMASLDEIKLALKTLRSSGVPNVAILHCISSYPAKSEEMNLLTISDLAKRFKVVSGLSDHTLTNSVAIAAVALGASIIEKHFTLRRADGGPDAAFSIEPKELKELVGSIRGIERSFGKSCYGVGDKESENKIFRRSLFVVRDIKNKERFTKENVRSIRPGHGLEPKYFDKILRKRARKDIEKGTPLSWDLIS